MVKAKNIYILFFFQPVNLQLKETRDMDEEFTPLDCLLSTGKHHQTNIKHILNTQSYIKTHSFTVKPCFYLSDFCLDFEFCD